MFSRKDIRSKQTKLLLDNGLLPISIDYRLCPEVDLLQGPMVDVCDALRWAREQLPTLKLSCHGLQVDGTKVVVVGWSSGGHLAMTLAWTARLQDLKPPEAVLAFYAPTDYEDDSWSQPNFPKNASPSGISYDVLDAVQEKPITSYNIPTTARPIHGWISPSDPRSRLLLHMNWHAQALPILLNGLPSKTQAAAVAAAEADPTNWNSLPPPTHSKIIAASPLAQIVRGAYRTPTFLLHGSDDDLIPCRQARRVHEALRTERVEAGIAIVEGKGHLFDIFHGDEGKEGEWEAVKEGYRFLFNHIK